MKKTILILTALILLTVSCEKVITFDRKSTAPLLVMNSMVGTDSTLRVEISKSRFFLDNSSNAKNISTATVTWSLNDVEQDTLANDGDGVYTYNYTPRAGDKISFQATENSYGTISSSTTIPAQPQVIRIDTLYTYDNKYSSSTSIFNFKITFQDEASTSDYYMISVVAKYANTYDQDSIYGYSYFPMNILCNDPIFNNETSNDFLGDYGYEDYVSSLIFSDNLINGKQYTLQIKTDGNNYYNYDDNQNNDVRTRYIIYFKKITKDWYLYQKSIDNYNESDEFFSEPVQIYTNINGGLGIVGGANVFEKEF